MKREISEIEAKRVEQHQEMTDDQVVFISTVAAMQNVADIADVNVCKKWCIWEGREGARKPLFLGLMGTYFPSLISSAKLSGQVFFYSVCL